MSSPSGFINFRAQHQEREDALAAQKELATRQASETINLLTSIVQAPGYKVWKELVIANAEMEHRAAMTAKTPHEMAIHIGAESAYRAAAHAAEDLIASNQNTIAALKQVHR